MCRLTRVGEHYCKRPKGGREGHCWSRSRDAWLTGIIKAVKSRKILTLSCYLRVRYLGFCGGQFPPRQAIQPEWLYNARPLSYWFIVLFLCFSPDYECTYEWAPGYLKVCYCPNSDPEIRHLGWDDVRIHIINIKPQGKPESFIGKTILSSDSRITINKRLRGWPRSRGWRRGSWGSSGNVGHSGALLLVTRCGLLWYLKLWRVLTSSVALYNYLFSPTLSAVLPSYTCTV